MPAERFRIPPPSGRRRPSDTRIAIVGAGAAGLSAAHYLRQKGYTHITVFDRRPRVGGKCLTRTIAGRRYELGALVVGRPYPRVRELIRAVGLITAPFKPIRIFDTRRPQTVIQAEELFYRCPALSRGRLLATYLKQRRRLSRPGYDGLEKTALAELTMEGWLRKRHLDDLRAVLAPFYVSWGYGYLENVSALYVFKLLDLYIRALRSNTLKPGRSPRMGYIPDGYQVLWERIAEPFELILGVDIQTVRRGTSVTIAYDHHVREFDALIVACPFDRALQFLDAGRRERRLFTRIQTLDFCTLAAEVDGLPGDALVFVRNHLTPDHAGRVISWYRRWPDSNLLVFYMIGSVDLKAEQMAETVTRDLAVGGAQVRRIHRCDHWRYFPHVDAQDFAGGFYRDFERLQGILRTWYTGELLSFPTVEHVVGYSQALVETHV
jgi:hypothetical protein